MTLTCNKKAYSDLRIECEMCSEKAECIGNGKGVLVEFAEMPLITDISSPILQDNSTVAIHVDSGFSFDVHRRDIEKSIKEQFNPLRNLLEYGA